MRCRHGDSRRMKQLRASRRGAGRVPESRPGDAHGSDCPIEGEGTLRVTTYRVWKAEVPVKLSVGPKNHKEAFNVVNQLGPVFAENVPVVPANDEATLEAAFNKRLNTKHSDDIEDFEFDSACHLIDSLQLDYPPIYDDEESYQDWLSKFAPPKRARMQRALEDCGMATMRDFTSKEIMIKQEVLLKRNDPDWAARIICMGTDVYNVVTGPIANQVAKRLKHMFENNRIGQVEYMTPYGRQDTEWCEFLANSRYDHWAEGDYSRNDSEQRRRVVDLYIRMLRKLNCPDWYVSLIEKSSRSFTVYSPAFGVRAFIENQLATGSTCTTNRNTIYNALMFAVSCDQQGIAARAVVLGDDLLAKTNRRIDVDRWVGTVLRFKMVLKGRVPLSAGDATFLSRRIYVDGDVACSMPKFGKALMRFNVRGTANSDVDDEEYMGGKALCYAYEFRHFPDIRDWFLARHAMCNNRWSDQTMTWNTKSVLGTREEMISIMREETVTVGRENLRDWMTDVYDIGMVDVDDLCEQVIVSSEQTYIQDERYFQLAIDV